MNVFSRLCAACSFIVPAGAVAMPPLLQIDSEQSGAAA
jgi:hypothetical protein